MALAIPFVIWTRWDGFGLYLLGLFGIFDLSQRLMDPVLGFFVTRFSHFGILCNSRLMNHDCFLHSDSPWFFGTLHDCWTRDSSLSPKNAEVDVLLTEEVRKEEKIARSSPGVRRRVAEPQTDQPTVCETESG